MELDMTKGSPFKLIMKFLMPVVIGNICQQLYNVADSIIVGKFVGYEALAAVGSMGTIMFLIIGFMNGMCGGFAVVTAQRFGAHDEDGVRATVCGGIILAAAITVVLTGISLSCMNGILRLMNTPDDVYEPSYTYIMIICGGLAFTVLYNLTSSFLRAIGNSKVPLYFLLLSAGMNIVLDLLLILKFNMGVGGAALATVISQGVSGILCLIYIIAKTPELSPKKGDWQEARKCMKQQFNIGLPMALQFSVTAIGTIIVQSALNTLGSVIMAAFTASQKVESICSQVCLALGTAMATFAGQNRGVNDYVRIRRGTFIGIMISVVYGAFVGLVLPYTVDWAIPLFVNGDPTAILEKATIFMNFVPRFFIPLGFIFVFRNVLQGMGYSATTLLGSFTELFARSIMSFMAIRQSSFLGVCYAEAFAWLSAGLLLGVCYFVIMRKYSRGPLYGKRGAAAGHL